MRRYIVSLALLTLALSGCGSNDETAPAESPSSASSSLSASPTETASATPTPTPTTTSSASESGEPSAAAPSDEPTGGSEGSGSAIGGPPMDQDGRTTSLNEFLASGGRCASDYFPAGPLTDEAMAEVQDYCASQENPAEATEPNGHQRPEADENGYVGPSKEFYDYEGYVEPGFEYQVGSECFEPSLGRCKTSGEIQSEYMAEQNGTP